MTDVKIFLDSKRAIKYQFVEKRQLDSTSDVRRSQYKSKNLSGIIQASIPNVSHSFANHRSVEIVFFFNKKKHLINYVVKSGGVGL